MDPAGLVRWRLFRESCCPYEGNYVKDLNCLGRDLSSTIIVDNSPHSYVFQPANAVPIGTFIDDMEDQELLELLPHLLQVEAVDDVRRYLGPNMMLLQQQQGQQQQQQQETAVAAVQQQQQVLVR
jgi:RNA polymerase II subunit A small phosphatase-like protein